MEPIFAIGRAKLYAGDARAVLRQLPERSVDVVINSPPYRALRAYPGEEQVWGETPGLACWHEWGSEEPGQRARWGDTDTLSEKQSSNAGSEAMVAALETKAGRYCTKCGAWKGQLGLEPTDEQYIANLVEVYREARRVLKPTGVLFLNIADSHSGSGKGRARDGTHMSCGDKQATNRGTLEGRLFPGARSYAPAGYPPGSLLQIPARVSLAMQADGWILRSGIVLPKAGPMPESVLGVRWERHKIKVGPQKRSPPGQYKGSAYGPDKRQGAVGRDATGRTCFDSQAKWEDCPGCKTCLNTAKPLYTLRWGSGRPTRAYEMLYMFSKEQRYFFNTEAVRKPLLPQSIQRDGNARWTESNRYEGLGDMCAGGGGKAGESTDAADMCNIAGANVRNVMRNPDPREGRGDLFGHYLTSRLVEAGVDPFLLFDASVEAIMDLAAAAAEQSDTLDWVPQPLGDAHYAAFPPFIPEFCLKAATAEVCCGACGAPYAPVVERINLGVTDRNVNNTRYTAGSESLNNTNGLENSTLRHELIRAVRRDKGLPGRSELGHDRSFPGGFSPKGHAAELWLPTCPCDPETAGTQPAVALDMFAGSGTTLQEAERLGRASIGIELAEVYQKIARRRLQRTHYGKDRLLPGQASLFDAPEEKEPRHPALPFAGPDEGRI